MVDITKSYENSSIKAMRSGTVESLDDGYMTIRTDDGHTDVYLLSGLLSMSKDAVIGNHVKQGQVLVQSRRMSQLHDQIADFCDFFGFQNSDADIGLGREKGRGKVLCYAPKAGVITYPTPNIIKIDDMEIPVNRAEIYFYPEGYKVEEGERFCSGLLDLNAFFRKNGRTQDTFDAMKKQLYETESKRMILKGDEWSSSTRSEVLELLYKCLVEFNFSARKKYTGTDNFLERMDYGDNKKGLAGFFKRSPNNVIEIQDSVIMPLVLGFEA